jgi:hypothetical protein
MMTNIRSTTLGSVIVWGLVAALLLIPAIAMQFTAEVDWTAGDFVVMGVLLGSLAGTYEFLARKAPNWIYRAGAALALFAALLLVWVNLAVGIIGSENNDANMMYAGVLAVAVGGACLAHFRSPGMARAMTATAAAQVLVAVIALATGAGVNGAIWPKDLIGATAILAALWLASAWLFRRAA